MGFLTKSELSALGLFRLGENVRISSLASLHGAERIHIGDNVRIDDFCVISAGTEGISIGNYVHIATGCSLMGHSQITLSDFSGLSSRVSIYSSSDDYTGKSLTNPTIPEYYRCVTNAAVFLGKHVIIGSTSVILPGVTIEEGVAVGALSLVTKNCGAFGIYSGNPAKRISERRRDLLLLEEEFNRKALGLTPQLTPIK